MLQLFSDKVKSAMKDKIQKRLTVSEEVPWRTIDKARAELESLGDPMIGSEGEKFVQDYQSLLNSCEE